MEQGLVDELFSGSSILKLGAQQAEHAHEEQESDHAGAGSNHHLLGYRQASVRKKMGRGGRG